MLKILEKKPTVWKIHQHLGEQMKQKNEKELTEEAETTINTLTTVVVIKGQIKDDE